MRPAPHHRNDPLLSIITVPEGMARSDLAQLIARATGLDERSLMLRLGLVPPMIVGQVRVEAAQRGIDVIGEHGGEAFAPTLADIESLGATLKIRHMELAHGRMRLELWRDPEQFIDARDVEILVRARTPGEAQQPLRYERPNASMRASSVHIDGGGATLPFMLALGLGGAYGLAQVVHSGDRIEPDAYAALPAARTPERWPSHKLDLHTRDGRVFQIDGDKFAFQVLGELRGMSDNVNIDRMCELFVHLNPDVIVDTYFNAFLPPPAAQRMRIPKMKINNDHSAFAFYSRWSALMYRHVMHAGGAHGA